MILHNMIKFLYVMTESFERMNHEIYKILIATTYEDKEKGKYFCTLELVYIEG